MVATIFLAQLVEGLDAQDDTDFMLPAGRQDGVHVQAMEAGKFVDIDLARHPAGAIDHFQHSADEEADDRAIDVLLFWIGAQADDLWGRGVVDVHAEIIGGKEVIELR